MNHAMNRENGNHQHDSQCHGKGRQQGSQASLLNTAQGNLEQEEAAKKSF
jgi:hypothetical protein